MTNKEIKISYTEYDSIEELDSLDRSVAEAAISAATTSYAPYSKFNVGAAVMLDDGEIISGSNQENAAFPSGLCAERTTMFYANAHRPEKAMVKIAIAGGPNGTLCKTPVSPCGACRQVMAQYQAKSGKPMQVILVGSDKIWKFGKVDDVLPFIFDNL